MAMTRGAKTRQRIVEGALQLFAEKGVDGTSVRDIALAADITEPAIYRHFESKDDLVWQVFSTHYGALGAALETTEATPAGPAGFKAQLAAMIREICGLYDKNPALFRFLLLTQHGQLGKVTEKLKSPVEVVKRRLARAIENGDLPRQDAELATSTVFGITLQAATFKVYGRLDKSMSHYCPALVAASWAALNPTLSH
jgi:AcrR family transcriptional regulator